LKKNPERNKNGREKQCHTTQLALDQYAEQNKTPRCFSSASFWQFEKIKAESYGIFNLRFLLQKSKRFFACTSLSKSVS